MPTKAEKKANKRMRALAGAEARRRAALAELDRIAGGGVLDPDFAMPSGGSVHYAPGGGAVAVDLTGEILAEADPKGRLI